MISPFRVRKTLRAFTWAAICMILGGCIWSIPSPFRPFPGPSKGPQIEDLFEAFDLVCRNYRLGPDDVLSLNVQTEWSVPAGSYRLDTLDEIEIEFILDPELNRRVAIRPDGMITFPGIGDISAAGLSPEQLAKKIESRLRDARILKDHVYDANAKDYRLVTVSVRQFYQKVRRLVESFTTLTSGQQMQVTVNPDGTVDLPLLKDRILAAGSTVTAVERTVNRAYHESGLRHVVVSLMLASAKSRKVYIMGHVNSPGAYEIRQPITVLQALALAGGHKLDTADLTSVILISRNAGGKPIGRRLDVKRILDVGDMSAAILVKPYDVIYVPQTYVRDVRLFMEQYFSTVAEVADFAKILSDIRTN